jgi:hypothetical protein
LSVIFRLRSDVPQLSELYSAARLKGYSFGNSTAA